MKSLKMQKNKKTFAVVFVILVLLLSVFIWEEKGSSNNMDTHVDDGLAIHANKDTHDAISQKMNILQILYRKGNPFR